MKSNTQGNTLKNWLAGAGLVAALAGAEYCSYATDARAARGFEQTLRSSPTQKGVFDASVPLRIAIRRELPKVMKSSGLELMIDAYERVLVEKNPQLKGLYVSAEHFGDPAYRSDTDSQVPIRYVELDGVEGFGR